MKRLIVLLPCLLYLAALNPWFLPNQYDNLLYFHTAKAIASEGVFHFFGSTITDWPIGLPLLLAIPAALGLDSILLSKIIVVIFSAFALWQISLWYEAENRKWSLGLTCLLGLLPVAFLMGSRIMAEWPYLACSFLFLNQLNGVTERNISWRRVIMAGFFLGAAACFRYVGVFLGAAVIAQAAIMLFKRSGSWWRRALPEVTVGAIGGGLFLVGWLWLQIQHDPQSSRYQAVNLSSSSYSYFHPETVLKSISNLFASTDGLLAWLQWQNPILQVLLWIPGLMVFCGFLARALARDLRPSDAYFVTCIAVFTIYEGANVHYITRYLLAVSPFLVSYAAEGSQWLLQALRIKPRSRAFALRWTFGLWLVGVLSIDGVYLLRGAPGGNHAGLSPLVTASAQDFYRGYWHDLFRAGEFMNTDSHSGDVALSGNFDWAYVTAFSGRTALRIPEHGAPLFWLAVEENKLQPPPSEWGPYETAMELPEVTLFRLLKLQTP